MTRFKQSIPLILCLLLAAVKLRAQQPSWVTLGAGQVKLDTSTAFSLFVADVNEDHYPDILVVKGGWNKDAEDNMRLYINIQDTGSTVATARIFVDATANSGINAMPAATGPSKGTLTAAFADINNDGHIDMVRGSYYHDQPALAPDVRCEVLLGDGMGHFTLVPGNGLHELGLINVTGFSFLDYDKDGKLDLFIARWFTRYRPDPEIIDPGILMHGNGDGTFTNVSALAGITVPEPMYGCSVTDWNNDGWPDIATAPYCRTQGQLWKNNRNGTFTNVAVPAGYNAQVLPGDNGQPVCLFGCAPEDFDNDGDMDFFFNLVHGGNDPGEGHSTIVMNSGAANDYKLSWDMGRVTWKAPKSTHQGDYDVAWFDLDNDGLIDAALGQGTYQPATDRLFVFRQQADHSFMDVTEDLGLLAPAAKDIHHMEAIDFDLDGDDDLVICKAQSPSAMHFIKNEKGQDNHWIGVRLDAPPGVNKSSIGARVFVWSGGVQHMREVYAGRGNNGGQQPFPLLFGLGSNNHIDSVKVHWPDQGNHFTVVRQPNPGQYITVGPGVDGVFTTAVQSPANNRKLNLKVYPNPAQDFVLVQFSDNSIPRQIEIYDLLGRLIKRVDCPSRMSTQYCSVRELAPGQYVLRAINDKQEHHTRHFTRNP